jgi:hypothetical protein
MRNFTNERLGFDEMTRTATLNGERAVEMRRQGSLTALETDGEE